MAKRNKNSPVGEGSFRPGEIMKQSGWKISYFTYWFCLAPWNWKSSKDKVLQIFFSAHILRQKLHPCQLPLKYINKTHLNQNSRTCVYLYLICSFTQLSSSWKHGVMGCCGSPLHRSSTEVLMSSVPSAMFLMMMFPLSLCSQLQWAHSVSFTQLWHFPTRSAHWSSSPSGSVQAQRLALMFLTSGTLVHDSLIHYEETGSSCVIFSTSESRRIFAFYVCLHPPRLLSCQTYCLKSLWKA